MLKILSELLVLEKDGEASSGGGGDGITSGISGLKNKFKAGYDRAKADAKTAATNAKEAAKQAEKAGKEAEQEEQAKEKETAEVKKKLTDQELKANIDSDIARFFDKFPFGGVGADSAELLDQLKDRKGALKAFTAYKGLAERTEQLLAGFNKSLVSSNKATAQQIKRFEQQAAKSVKGGAGTLPAQLSKFARGEANFFKRLVKIKDDFQLDDQDFKALLSLKLKNTPTERVGDAAQALNLLFTYMASEFRNAASTIADAGRKMAPDTEETST